MITMEDVQASGLNDEGLTESEVAACLIGAELFDLSPEDVWGNEYDHYINTLAAAHANSIEEVAEIVADEWIPTMAFADYAEFQIELGAEEEGFLTKLLTASRQLRDFCGDNDIPLGSYL